MKLLIPILLFLPYFADAQTFYISEIDKPIYNSLKNRISVLGYSVTENKQDADFVTELVYEKKKGYFSFKSGYNKVGFIRFLNSDGDVIAKTKEQGGIARGYNTYSALSSLYKKIMRTDFDSTITVVAKSHSPVSKKEASVAGSKADEIAKLKKLVDDGALTTEEFEAEKKKILEKD